MTKNKSKLILDTDFYSAHLYEVEEETNDKDGVSMAKLIKPLMVLLLISTIVLVYIYFIRSNLTEIGAWLSKAKQVILLEETTVVAVKTDKVKEEKVMTIKKVEQKIKVKQEIPASIKSKPINNDKLTDEYIKLVEQSLGKY